MVYMVWVGGSKLDPIGWVGELGILELVGWLVGWVVGSFLFLFLIVGSVGWIFLYRICMEEGGV